MKKILFLALHLGFGGAEKAIVSEANILVDKYEVEIACVYKLYEKPAFLLDERVKVSYLSENIKPNKDEFKMAIGSKNPIAIVKEGLKSIQVLYYRTALMKKKIKSSDANIIISTRLLYHQLLVNNKKNDVITIAQEHNHHNNDEGYIKKIVESVKGIDYFMPVSNELTEFYGRKIKGTVCKYIPHSLDYIPQNISLLNKPILVSVGRLSKEKGFVDLIKVFALVHEKHPEWILHIVGDGDEKANVEKQILEKNLQGSVVLHGYQNKEYINELLRQSSIYVMASFSESFGIVLIEAQSFGIPCIAFDSARGALEIIEHEKNGYVVENRDHDAMCGYICQLIENADVRKVYGAASRENAFNYSTEHVKKLWYQFIESM